MFTAPYGGTMRTLANLPAALHGELPARRPTVKVTADGAVRADFDRAFDELLRAADRHHRMRATAEIASLGESRLRLDAARRRAATLARRLGAKAVERTPAIR